MAISVRGFNENGEPVHNCRLGCEISNCRIDKDFHFLTKPEFKGTLALTFSNPTGARQRGSGAPNPVYSR
jgi:hypothetical protein